MTVPGVNNTNRQAPTPYDTAEPFIMGGLPNWVTPRFDRLRLGSYRLYDDIYKNVKGTFAIVARGTENNPIYIPSGKTLIEACNRYLAVGFDYSLSGGAVGDRAAAQDVMDKMFRRNKFFSKFITQKRNGLIRGDAMWHVVAYPTKTDPADRIALYELDPGTYFAITDPDDNDIVTGCLITKKVADPVNQEVLIIRRQKYSINDDGTIQSQMNYYPMEAWDDRINPDTNKPWQQNVGPLNGRRMPEPFDITLPKEITNLPVYHIKNTRISNDPFGLSEMSGVERIIAAVNQGISDEELALALDGLGLYATTSGPPTDDRGNPTNWVLGPGRVVEIEADATFSRVSGVTSVAASISHLDWLVKALRENSATADIAVGIVDSPAAVSGIALAFQMAPLLAKNAEKEAEMMDEYDTMFTDLLTRWIPAYTDFTPAPKLDIVPVMGDPLPVDRAEVLAEVTELYTQHIITLEEAQSMLKDKLGMEFKFSSPDAVLSEAKALAVARDPFGARLADELGDGTTNQGDSSNGTQPPPVVAGAVAAPPASTKS